MKTLKYLTLFLFLSVGLFAQRNGSLSSSPTSSANQINQAKNFGLDVVKSYIDFNCSFVFERLASTYKIFDTGVLTQKGSVAKDVFCGKNPLRGDMRVTYSMYLANYTPEVLDHIQFANRYPSDQRLLNLTAGDFYFNGANLNNGGLRLFNIPNVIRFVIRKNARGNFEIIAI
jgi:hypothetical protein